MLAARSRPCITAPTNRRAQRGDENFGGSAGVRSEIRYFGGAFAAFFPVSGPACRNTIRSRTCTGKLPKSYGMP